MTRPPRTRRLTRRGFVAGGIASIAGGITPAFPLKLERIPLVVHDDRPEHTISPLIFGSNEIGAMDGGALSSELDRLALVTARRLGGDLMTAYNWVNNATNAGKNHRQSNGPFLLEALQVPKDRWSKPAAVIETMHDASLALGAKSLVTVPLAGFVAADMAGPVKDSETAPSARFVPVVWNGSANADDPIDPAVANMPQLLARLIAKYGNAASADGIHAYALDNEPAIWYQNHPRLMRKRIGIGAFIARSIEAARVIKTIDPAARVFGPASWGATEMASFQDAPDWKEYRQFGSFLAAYLDAFAKASQQEGRRLLDVLDIHWYPFSTAGGLFRTEKAELDEALLAAPRTLTDPDFIEESWVPRAMGHIRGFKLPLLPGLKQLTERWFPGTEIAVTEFNYGGAGQLVSALALADVLGRFSASGVYFATHWGSLEGWLQQAYRLYRLPDASGASFGGRMVPVTQSETPDVVGYAAEGKDALRLVLINKSHSERTVEVRFASRRARNPAGVLGFGAGEAETVSPEVFGDEQDGVWRLVLPARSARRYAFA